MAEVSVKSIPIRLDMRGDTQIENITKRVQEAVADTGLKAGIATVFIRHTTASVMLIEDEPGIRADTKAIWDRLVRVVNDPTTSHVNPPVVTPVRKAVYDFLLDHMVLTAALVRQLALGDYRVHQVGTQGFFGDDGQGSEALFDLLYLAPTQRVYHVQGSHHGKIFSLVTGEAIVLLTAQTRSDNSGKGSVETQMAVYSRLDNPVLATLVKVLQPLLRGAINEKLAGPFLAVHRLGELIAADPEQVYKQAETISELDKAEVDALRALLF